MKNNPRKGINAAIRGAFDWLQKACIRLTNADDLGFFKKENGLMFFMIYFKSGQ
jgi:hypothetical protein